MLVTSGLYYYHVPFRSTSDMAEGPAIQYGSGATSIALAGELVISIESQVLLDPLNQNLHFNKIPG